MDIQKILFCTSISTSMDLMLQRSFKLAYRYNTTLEVFHVMSEQSEKTKEETNAIIEEHILGARPGHLKNVSYQINIVQGKFREQFIQRISQDDNIFILTGHTEKNSNHFQNFTEFLSTISHSEAHTFIFKQSENPQPITEMHYVLKFDYSDLRVLNALTTVGADLEITYNLHYSSKVRKNATRDIKALTQVYGTRLHSNLARFIFIDHEEAEYEIEYEAHDIMVITKNELIAAAYDINQDPRAVLILNV